MKPLQLGTPIRPHFTPLHHVPAPFRVSAQRAGAVAFVVVVRALLGREGEALDCAVKNWGGVHDLFSSLAVCGWVVYRCGRDVCGVVVREWAVSRWERAVPHLYPPSPRRQDFAVHVDQFSSQHQSNQIKPNPRQLTTLPSLRQQQ